MNVEIPLTGAMKKRLKAGDLVYLSGVIYTARDQAHKKIADLIEKGYKLPFDLKGAVIYYCGPAPRKKGDVIGSCGPTTSSRMDKLAPLLYSRGVSATIGKGGRDDAVIAAVRKYKGLYFVTWGGCGAYLKRCVEKSQLQAFPELGAEAIYKLTVKNFPAIVAIDASGAVFSLGGK